MKKILKWGAIGFGVLILIGVVASVGKSGSNQQPSTNTNTSGSSNNNNVTNTPPEAKAAPMVIEATALVGEYDKNKLAADDKYTGKTIQTTAYIKNISSDIVGSYYLSLNPTNEQYYFGTSIQCYFKDKSSLTSLSNGQSITVVGTMNDMSIGTVIMKDCNVVK